MEVTRKYLDKEVTIGAVEKLANGRFRAQCFRSGLFRSYVNLDEAKRWLLSW